MLIQAGILLVVPPHMFNIPWMFQFSLVQGLQVIRSLSFTVDNFVGSFPIRAQFPMRWVLGCQRDLFQDEIPYVESLGFTIASYCLAMRFLYFAVLCSASVLTSSIRSRFKWSCSSLSLSWYVITLWLAMCTSAGMTASLPYANLKGVSPVGVLTIVLYTHKTPGNSSGHTPFAPSSRVLMIFNKDQFATSTWLFAWGWAGEE